LRLSMLLRGYKPRVSGVAAVSAMAVLIYTASHRLSFVDRGLAGACLTIGSGLAWATAVSLPARHRTVGLWLNRLAATLVIVSGICSLP
jgi:hypothetical protein